MHHPPTVRSSALPTVIRGHVRRHALLAAADLAEPAVLLHAPLEAEALLGEDLRRTSLANV